MTLSTNLDVHVHVDPVVAGIEKGRLRNDWLDCPFEIAPAPAGARGVVWKAMFNATDDPSVACPFNGAAETRRQAKQIIVHTLTARMATVVQQRATRVGLRVVADGGVTAPAPGVLGWFLRMLVKVRSWFRRNK